jgi:acetyltransferase-like isoleucine patch superfamily enzyme
MFPLSGAAVGAAVGPGTSVATRAVVGAGAGVAALPQALSRNENAIIVEMKMKLILRIFFLLLFV